MNLFDLQHELELRSVAEGIARDAKDREYLSNQGEASVHPSSQTLIKSILPMVSTRLKSLLEDGKGEHVSILRSVDPDVLAFIGLWHTFNSISMDESLRSVSVGIGAIVQDHVWIDALKGDPKFAKVYRQVTSRYADTSERRKALSRRLDATFDRWPATLRLRIGAVVVNALLLEGIVELRKNSDGIDHLDFTSNVLGAIADVNAKATWISASKLPMVVAPKPWRGYEDGGYLTRTLQRMNPVVRSHSSKHRKLVEAAIEDGSMAKSLEALNVIQATPWRVNRKMLSIIMECHERGLVIDGLPRKTLLVMPPKVVETEDNIEEQKKVRRQRAEVRRRNTTIQGQLVTFRSDIDTALRLTDVERFWLPHNMDFRGRVYPVPFFNQQRSDYVKALMEFADGVAIDDEGFKWLLIAAANAGDFGKVSKQSFDDRIRWGFENAHWMADCAREPFVHTKWMEADKPFAFLRACIEIDDFNISQGCGRGPFMSHLPVQIDGSNSGLQHYSAILRSTTDGSFVNLVPQAVPADVYAEVARRVDIEAKSSQDPLAALWLSFGITRKIVKRNVMTFPYSSETFGFREQIMEDLMIPLNDEVIDGKRPSHPFGEDGGWAAAGWMAKAVYAAVVQTVSAASGAMKYLKGAAGALAHESSGLVYVTPCGLPVLHEYTEWDCKRVTVWLYDRSMPIIDASSSDIVTNEGVYRRIQSTLRVRPTKVIVKSKQKSAVAPNVIHSMDASHLMLTTLAAIREGVSCFSLIHDSFGTHASHMPVLFRVVREQMVEMYQAYDPLLEIKSRAEAVLSEKGKAKLGELPERGDLDLNLIKSSAYAFA